MECLTDHQYAGAIGKSGDEQVASSVMDRIPEPSENDKEAVDKVKTDFDSLKASSWGRYIMCEAYCAKAENEGAASGEKASRDYWRSIQNYLDDVTQYELIRFPLLRDVQNVLDRSENLKAEFGSLLEKILEEAKEYDSEVRTELHHRVVKSRSSSTSGSKNSESNFRAKAASVLEPVAKDSSPSSVAAQSIDELPPLVKLRAVFKDLTDACEKMIKTTCYSAFEASEDAKSLYKRRRWFLDRETTAEDFVVFRDLGKGAFGVVSGAKNRFTGQMTALKTMQRKLVVGKKAHKVVKDERAILVRLGKRPNPFVVHAKHCFYDSNNFYFALPLMTGGDLSFHLKREGSFDEERTRFWSSQILLGLEHMHSLGVVYRDLKPENVLLDSVGNLRISDLGLAYLTKYTPMTMGNKGYKGRAGTPGYWCPEMVQKSLGPSKQTGGVSVAACMSFFTAKTLSRRQSLG